MIDDGQSVIGGSWSTLIRRRSVVITRDWRIVIKGWSTTSRSWGVLVRSYTANSPGDANSTTAGDAPDVPHHETTSTRPNPRVEDTFDNAHATGATGTNLPTACVELNSAKRDPFHTSEEENRVIKTPNDIQRCHPLHESALPGKTGTGIIGAEIIDASSHGIFGATLSGSPSHIEAIAFGITRSTSCWIIGQSISWTNIITRRPFESLDHRHLGPRTISRAKSRWADNVRFTRDRTSYV